MLGPLQIIKGGGSGQEIRQHVSPLHLPNAPGGAQSVYVVRRSQRVSSSPSPSLKGVGAPDRGDFSRGPADIEGTRSLTYIGNAGKAVGNSSVMPIQQAFQHLPFCTGASPGGHRIVMAQSPSPSRSAAAATSRSPRPTAGRAWLDPQHGRDSRAGEVGRQSSSWLQSWLQDPPETNDKPFSSSEQRQPMEDGDEFVFRPSSILAAALATPVHSWFANPAFASAHGNDNDSPSKHFHRTGVEGPGMTVDGQTGGAAGLLESLLKGASESRTDSPPKMAPPPDSRPPLLDGIYSPPGTAILTASTSTRPGPSLAPLPRPSTISAPIAPLPHPSTISAPVAPLPHPSTISAPVAPLQRKGSSSPEQGRHLEIDPTWGSSASAEATVPAGQPTGYRTDYAEDGQRTGYDNYGSPPRSQAYTQVRVVSEKKRRDASNPGMESNTGIVFAPGVDGGSAPGLGGYAASQAMEKRFEERIAAFGTQLRDVEAELQRSKSVPLCAVLVGCGRGGRLCMGGQYKPGARLSRTFIWCLTLIIDPITYAWCIRRQETGESREAMAARLTILEGRVRCVPGMGQGRMNRANPQRLDPPQRIQFPPVDPMTI